MASYTDAAALVVALAVCAPDVGPQRAVRWDFLLPTVVAIANITAPAGAAVRTSYL